MNNKHSVKANSSQTIPYGPLSHRRSLPGQRWSHLEFRF